jgi:hypothetical protein
MLAYSAAQQSTEQQSGRIELGKDKHTFWHDTHSKLRKMSHFYVLFFFGMYE